MGKENTWTSGCFACKPVGISALAHKGTHKHTHKHMHSSLCKPVLRALNSKQVTRATSLG